MSIDNGGEREADREGLPLLVREGIRPCNRLGRRAWTVAGVVVGLGSGGGIAQIWSPSSSRGTNWPQVEHLGVGRFWDIRVGLEGSICAIMLLWKRLW